MSQLKVTQVRSVIDRPKDQKDTVRGLGLHGCTTRVVKDDRPEIRGMIAKVRHLVASKRSAVARSAVEGRETDEAPSSPPGGGRSTRAATRVGRGRAAGSGQDRRPRHEGLGARNNVPSRASRAARCRFSAASRS